MKALAAQGKMAAGLRNSPQIPHPKAIKLFSTPLQDLTIFPKRQ
jgi:hypothetical protein